MQDYVILHKYPLCFLEIQENIICFIIVSEVVNFMSLQIGNAIKWSI